MKKLFVVNLLLILVVFIAIGVKSVHATNVSNTNNNLINNYVEYWDQTPLPAYNNTVTEPQPGTVSEIKSKTSEELSDYEQKYGSKAYGYTAYALNKLRIFSIPLCFLGIAVGSIYQYVIGIRKMDVRDRGFALIVGFVTVLVIFQVLPLIFAVVVQGWRG